MSIEGIEVKRLEVAGPNDSRVIMKVLKWMIYDRHLLFCNEIYDEMGWL